MILTTTPTVEGHRIIEYKGIVFGEVVNGVNFIKDFGASLRNIVGGRSDSYESELIDARQNAIYEMERRARSMGANAVVGIDIDYEPIGASGSMLMSRAACLIFPNAPKSSRNMRRSTKGMIIISLLYALLWFSN